MHRRKFLSYLFTGGLMSINHAFPGSHSITYGFKSLKKAKNWLWLSPGNLNSKSDIEENLTRIKKAGFDAILVQSFNGRKTFYKSSLLPAHDHVLEKLIPLAKSTGLEIHAWIFCLICNADKIREEHPEWFCVNRNLQSSLEKPPYVGYYHWLCPSRSDVTNYLSAMVSELVRFDDLDGIHLDYIRYPDVILPDALQSKYDLVQESELPQFDFCYCPVCRHSFKEAHHIDPLELKDPSGDLLWREFREQNITRIVLELAQIARSKNKKISAAVFPTPVIARKLVRQNWSTWDIDAFFPMIYHKYYNKELDWIRTATREGVDVLSKVRNLYSGLYLPFLTPGDLVTASEYAQQGGADGVALFAWDNLNEAYWHLLRNKL